MVMAACARQSGRMVPLYNTFGEGCYMTVSIRWYINGVAVQAPVLTYHATEYQITILNSIG
jgi:hypothetical protein